MARELSRRTRHLEKAIRAQIKTNPLFEALKTVNGIDNILAMTILLETGEITCFACVGHYASYCRCVDSRRESNGKKKGEGNRKNGNRYLAWAFIEAANFAIRYNAKAKRFYERKKARTNNIVALKALAHKLATACCHIMRTGERFDENKLFA